MCLNHLQGTLLEANRLQFSCANTEKSEKTKVSQVATLWYHPYINSLRQSWNRSQQTEKQGSDIEVSLVVFCWLLIVVNSQCCVRLGVPFSYTICSHCSLYFRLQYSPIKPTPIPTSTVSRVHCTVCTIQHYSYLSLSLFVEGSKASQVECSCHPQRRSSSSEARRGRRQKVSSLLRSFSHSGLQFYSDVALLQACKP